jgi:methylenetetrahydrofolate reductase (NADPH)
VSFELFPGRNEKGEKKLLKVIDKLAAVGPDFVSVTFGAGGRTRDGSRELVRYLKHEKGLEVLPYFAGIGLGPDEINEVVAVYREVGAESLLVVRGDTPEDPDFSAHPDSLPHASDLLAFIREHHPTLCIGGAAYPEGHKDAESLEQDLEFVKLKVERGAQFIITQYFYDNRLFFDFRERCKALGIAVPIVAGVMPIFSVKMMEQMASLCGAIITDEVRQGIAKLPEDDKDALFDFGADLAVNQCRELIEAGVPGLHFYTLDKSRSSVAIVKRLREEGLI